MKLAEQYDDRELELVSDYLEKSSAISEAELAKVIAANRGGAEPGENKKERKR
jgi:hypothetical protein